MLTQLCLFVQAAMMVAVRARASAEYLFLGISDNVQACGPDSVGTTFCFNQKFEEVHTAKLGVNYHF